MPPDSVIIVFPFLVLLVARCCFCQLKLCYNPYGVTFPDFPCDPGADVSACCGLGSTCKTNFYCETQYPHGGTAVGSCTDKTWQNPACPLPLNIFYPFNFTLNTTACADGTFCPNPDNQTCCFNHQGFTLTSYHYHAALPTAATALSTFYADNGYQLMNITSSSSKYLPTTSPSSPSSPSPSSSHSPSSPPSSLHPLPVFPSTSVPTSSYISTSSPDANSPSPLSTGRKAGIGIGAVAGSLSIAGMALFLLCRMRRRHRRDERRHPRISTPLAQRQWEKPELLGEDAYTEMEAEERRRAELPGTEARMEMGAADLGEMLMNELPS